MVLAHFWDFYTPCGVGGDKIRKDKRKVGMSGMPETGSRAHARSLLRNDDVSVGVRCQMV